MLPSFRLAALILPLLSLPGLAAPCSNDGGQFEAWKPKIAAEAKSAGVGPKGLAALQGASYSKATIAADRNQKSFKYTLQKFLSVRGADAIVSQGRARKKKNRAEARSSSQTGLQPYNHLRKQLRF